MLIKRKKTATKTRYSPINPPQSVASVGIKKDRPKIIKPRINKKD